jgi:hypothetical protein
MVVKAKSAGKWSLIHSIAWATRIAEALLRQALTVTTNGR